jgi:hypothetical protein
MRTPDERPIAFIVDRPLSVVLVLLNRDECRGSAPGACWMEQLLADGGPTGMWGVSPSLTCSDR